MNRDPVIAFNRVAKRFASPRGPVDVLRDIDLTVAAGEFLAVTGPSGSGKTTLLHLAALLDHPTTGDLRFEGEPVSELDEDALSEVRKHRVGMVFQKYCLLPHRSVLDNVLFRFRYLEHDRKEARERAMAALERVGLHALTDRQARLLSGGEMQRVAVARAVALPPRLLVADEPTGNLDSVATIAVMDTLKELNREGLTIILVTHNQALLPYCSRHVVCRDGCISAAAA